MQPDVVLSCYTWLLVVLVLLLLLPLLVLHQGRTHHRGNCHALLDPSLTRHADKWKLAVAQSSWLTI